MTVDELRKEQDLDRKLAERSISREERRHQRYLTVYRKIMDDDTIEDPLERQEVAFALAHAAADYAEENEHMI